MAATIYIHSRNIEEKLMNMGGGGGGESARETLGDYSFLLQKIQASATAQRKFCSKSG